MFSTLRLYMYGAVVLATIAVLTGLYYKGMHDNAQDVLLRDLQNNAATNERINDAPISSTPDDAIEWLRTRRNR